MNVKLEAALAYGRMGWRIFPCHSIIQFATGPACSCGGQRGKAGKIIGPCKSPGKHPRTKLGLREATDDEATIRKWWSRWPDANIALATGSGLAVFDIDGAKGAEEFKALVEAHGPVPATLTARTGRGFHLVYATWSGAGEVRSSARGNVHVRGEGGYIIVEPSNHISGRNYQWIKKVAVASLPDWLRQWSQGYEISKEKTNSQSQAFKALGLLPSYLQNSQSIQPNVTKSASEALSWQWTPAEQARLISALQAIPVKACGYDEFLKIGFALHSLEWSRSDGTSIGFDIWNDWCAQSEHHNQAGLESKWKSLDRSARGEVSIASIYHMARQMGWNGGAPAIEPSGAAPPLASPGGLQGPPSYQAPHLNGTANGVKTLPAAFGGQQPIFFPDLNDKNLPRATMLNAKVAVQALGVDCKFDLFHNRMLVAGELINKWNSTELYDHVTAMLRDVIRFKFGFDPNKQNTRDACEALCLARRFDPILDYLDSLQWDGQPRLDTWMNCYLGASNTDLYRAVARLSLIAAVRRVRSPGTKFDQIIVLEGKEGRGKSEAIRILAGTDNFSDQKILGVDDRKQQELTEGVWLYEISELTGLRKAEIEHVKAFASRLIDRARPAYGHYTVGQRRRTIFFATTNQEVYLQGDTGNRRFWPVATGRLDLAGLVRDRDQIWAEASRREAAGETHVLDEGLWETAGELQESRKAHDEWEEAIGKYIELKNINETSIMEVLTDNQFLQLRASEIGQREQNRAASILRGLNFTRYQKCKPNGQRPWRYRRI